MMAFYHHTAIRATSRGRAIGDSRHHPEEFGGESVKLP
jgi:hypothetical protein